MVFDVAGLVYAESVSNFKSEPYGKNSRIFARS